METLTFLFTDIEGSTGLLGRLGEAAYAGVLARHQDVIRSGLAAWEGREVVTQGDGFFAVFSSPRSCVWAVLRMQQELGELEWPDGEQVRVRMGVHTGEAADTSAGLVGLDVHRAARIAAVAHGGQVLLSEAAAALARGGLPPAAGLADLGVHRLKDLGRPERIFQLIGPGLDAGFPPLRSLGNPELPNNLPAQLTSFVGRARELGEVRALAASSRLVTLTGPGGCGKTRLALQVAAELLDRSGDGVWLVELAAVSDEDEVPGAVAAVLGIACKPGRPMMETLLDAFVCQDVLIVLDNCEHVIGACAKIADALLRRCPRVYLMATSREPLGINGETIYRVPPLSLPGPADSTAAALAASDAVALFIERARAQGVALTLDEQTGPLVVSVCRQLDGLPLAIELAAARLRSMSLAGLLDRLDQRLGLLTGGSRAAPQRQQTLRGTVDWSYSLLTDAERLLLRRLSVFAEGFGLDAAEAVCGFGAIGPDEVAGLLGSLVDESLVVAEHSEPDWPAAAAVRYRLLETIRQYAAEQLAGENAAEAAAVAAAHCAHFLAVAEAAAPHLTGPDQGSWFAKLDADHANLRRAAAFAAADPGGTGRVLRFGVALRRYWMARSRDTETLALLVPALDRPGADANPWQFGAALVTAAAVTQAVAPARELGQRAVEFARRLGDDRLLIDALATLSGTYYFGAELENGLLLGAESVERARRLADDVLLGVSLTAYLLFSDRIDPAEFDQLFDEAIACIERSGDQLYDYFVHINGGVRALRIGDIRAARAYLEQAEQAMQATGHLSHLVWVNLGWVLREEGDPDEARSKFDASLRMSRRNGEYSGIAYACLGLACLAADRGDWYRAAELHGVTQAFLDRTGELWQEPEASYRRQSLARVRAGLGAEQFERAYAHSLALSFDEALDLAMGRVSVG